MEQNKDDASRRQVLVKIGLGALAWPAAGRRFSATNSFRRTFYTSPRPSPTSGKPDRFPPDSVTADPVAGIYIVHAAEGFYALTATCTHLGCLTAWKPELNIIACPCHGSKFNRRGVKIDGPAPRPLAWLKVWVSDEGDLLVDRSTPVPQDHFVRV